MPAERFVEQLNIQIGHEFAAHQQYVACAVYYDSLTMPQMAGFFYDQAVEERDHAMMMIKYLIDQDAPALVPGVSAPQADFPDVVAPVELALEQERRVTAQINALTRILAHEEPWLSVNSICPGWVRTDMGGRGAPRSVERGADTAVWLATTGDPPSGGFYRDRKPIPW